MTSSAVVRSAQQPPSSSSDALLELRSRCAELELQVAQKDNALSDLSRKFHDVQSRQQSAYPLISASNDSVAPSSSSAYQTQKQILQLLDQKAALEAQNRQLQESLSSFQTNITREIQKAKDEGEKQLLFTKSQLFEARELNQKLQERIIAQSALVGTMKDTGMEDLTTERLVIASDAVLHRFAAEQNSTSFTGKYNVSVEFTGRTMTMTGKRVHVQLLKADVLAALNEMYASLINSKSGGATKPKESNKYQAELDHLSRSVQTQQSTIDALHVALQHAQDKVKWAMDSLEQEKRQTAVVSEQCRVDVEQANVAKCDVERKLGECQRQLNDAQEAARLTLESLKQESRVSAEFRKENEMLRRSMETATNARDLAERASYVASEQVRTTQATFADLLAKTQELQLAKQASRALAEEVRQTKLSLEAVQKEVASVREDSAIERGKYEEKLSSARSEIANAQAKLEGINKESDALRRDVALSKEIIQELRGHANADSSASSMAARLARLEEENTNLRSELQQSFEDLKAVSIAMKETKGVREQALADAEQLEIEKAQLSEQLKKAEGRAAELLLEMRSTEQSLQTQLKLAKEEVEHQRKRADMLHVEYQKRIRDAMEPHGGGRVTEESPNDVTLLPRQTPPPTSAPTSGSPMAGKSVLPLDSASKYC